MKKSYVFVGSLPSHMMGVVSFMNFGQRASLTEEQASDLARGGARIAPAAGVEALGITDAEWRKYAAFGAHLHLTPEFAVKKAAALAVAEHFCEECVAVEAERLALSDAAPATPVVAEGVEV